MATYKAVMRPALEYVQICNIFMRSFLPIDIAFGVACVHVFLALIIN